MTKTGEDTPMLKQYFSIKAQHPEAILLYRVGDFYETYSDDAVLASKVLGLVLTKRSNGEKGDMEMAGFPHHAIEGYLRKLVGTGYKVAICDQLEDPSLAKNKLVKRGITEILTPGITFGEAMLEGKENNYLAGLFFDKDQCGAAFLDVSTGSFRLAQGSKDYISTLFSHFSPKEVLSRREDASQARLIIGENSSGRENECLTTIDEWAFVFEAAQERLCNQLNVKSLKGFGVGKFPLGVCAAGALLAYLEQTQHFKLSNICSLSRIDEDKFVWMDRFTLDNLEIFRSAGGKEDGVSLVETIDKCRTPMGSRLLRQWLSMPLMDIKRLESRYDAVQFFVSNDEALSEIRHRLDNLGDAERILSRVATGKALPRELLQLGRALGETAPIYELCRTSGVDALTEKAAKMHDTTNVLSLIKNTLAETPAVALGKGDVIAEGVNSELDEMRRISRGGKEYLATLSQREMERTGISSLKISYNNVFGYFIEVRNSSKDKVPPEWIRKQTLVNAERYITPELKEYEEKILNAENGIFSLESRLYAELLSSLQLHVKDISENCRIISQLDVLQGYAKQAADWNYCRPQVDKSSALDIKEGRHPVIETLMPAGEEYIPNDLHMDSKGDQIIIMTGPNMSGKSALLRGTALIVLMAQAGSFVPAKEVRMGYFDKIFTRVGSSDNISRGESTFMVEMIETSMIMHNLSARSLVLLDEIGRGTSTYDGMSIARSLVEYIHTNGKGAKTLFATHYHELNDLENIYPRVKDYHISVKEDGKNVIFLRKLVPGGVAHSFGIHVARLAGMPKEVIESAERTLRELEQREKHANSMNLEDDGSLQLSFFQLDDPTLSAIKEKLERANLDNMTPLQAFDLLREMKRELGV